MQALILLVFTSCVCNYLPKARVLAESLKKHNPDWTFCLVLADQPPDGSDISSPHFDQILPISALGIPNYRAWMFQHRLVELCTAVKGPAMLHFLASSPKVMYLDPDILVTASLEPLANMLDTHDILLTPHQLMPQNGAQAIVDNEICSLQHGVFNLGFLACANRPQGLAFARFWKDRLSHWCRDDKAQGLFTDQKWCDLAPAYFPSLGIVRDPGCNAASWNLTDRTIEEGADGEFLANGKPLRFYHFTGYESGMGKVMTRIYGGNMPAVSRLWSMYERKLDQAGQAEWRDAPWPDATYSNGSAITDMARHWYRDNPALQAMFPDPYLTDETGQKGYAGYWRKYRAREDNKFYVWARKPFRLAWLTGVYLKRHGGIGAVPMLARRVSDIWAQGGFAALLGKVRKFREKTLVIPTLELADVIGKRAVSAGEWQKLLARAFSGDRGVLLLDHQYGGGANDYREERLEAFLSEGRPCLLLTWDFFGGRLKCSFRLPNDQRLDVDAADLAELLKQDSLRFGLILVNELVLWSSQVEHGRSHYNALAHLLDVIGELKKRNNARLEFAIHDFYSVCPDYTLLEKGRSYCGVSRDEARCEACLKAGPFNVPADFKIAEWRKTWQRGFDLADEIRLFSASTRDIMQSVFHIPDARVNLVPHAPLSPLAPLAPPAPSAKTRIGVIGHITYHKGAEIVRQMAKLLRDDEELIVIGELEGERPQNVEATGAYSRDDLPRLTRSLGITSVLAPSIWPETFCYVVQETMQLGLPLVVFPLGAQAERVAAYPQGAIAENISAEAALKAIRKLEEARKNGRQA